MHFPYQVLIRARALAALVFLCGAAALGARADTVKKLPAFSLPDLDGRQWNSKDFAGKPLVLDFWATWCASCKETIPLLAELSEKNKGKGLTVIGISLDKGSAEKVRKAAKKLGINYLVLQDKENSLAQAFGFSGIPSVFVYDRKGGLAAALPEYNSDQDTLLAAAASGVL